MKCKAANPWPTEPTHAYVWVYRRPLSRPELKYRKQTRTVSRRNAALREFLREYRRKDRYYDWGDDPSFFSAERFLGDVRRASLAVCRPPQRKLLDRGDLVIFFCAQERHNGGWRYYYIGFGTVAVKITDRTEIWTNEQYQDYRRFFNLLIDKNGQHREVFYPWHDEKLIQSPYLIFDSDPALTDFNLVNPLHVASYTPNKGNHETWRSSTLAKQLQYLLFDERGNRRTLRSSASGSAHVAINLMRAFGKRLTGRSLSELREALSELPRV